jgi:hypothetical protein
MTGLIVGRFQVPRLTRGHQRLLTWAAGNYDRLIIGLGCSAEQDERNPLPFLARQSAVLEAFSDYDLEAYPSPAIVPVMDIPTDHRAWTQALDRLARTLVPDLRVEMIGGRDSFLITYFEQGGDFPCRQLPSIEHDTKSGTETRLTIPPEWHNRAFRAGYIYGRQSK